MVVNVTPGAASNNPSEDVVAGGDEGVVHEVESKSDVVGDLGVGISRSSGLLVEPLEESLDGELESPGGSP